MWPPRILPIYCFYGISRAGLLLEIEGAGLVCERLSQRTARIQDSIEAWCGLALPKDVYDIRTHWRWPHEKLSLFHMVRQKTCHSKCDWLRWIEMTNRICSRFAATRQLKQCLRRRPYMWVHIEDQFDSIWFKHHRLKHGCTQKWQIQWYGTFTNIRIFHSMPALRKVATCNATCAAPRADSQDTNTWRWISASGSPRHGTQSSHVAPARNARCTVMCNVMCHVIATLMVMWLFKLRKPAGKLAGCYSRTKWE